VGMGGCRFLPQLQELSSLTVLKDTTLQTPARRSDIIVGWIQSASGNNQILEHDA